MVGKIIITIVLVILVLILIAVLMWGIGVWSFAHAWSPSNWFGSNNTWNLGSDNEISAEGFQIKINDNEFSIGTSNSLPADAQSGLEFSTPSGDIKKIHLDFYHEDVTVVESDSKDIRLEQTINGTYQEKDIMRFGVVNNTLVAQTGWYNTAINVGMHPSSHITAYIPKGLQLDCVIDTASGSVDVETGLYQNLNIDTASGAIDVTDVTANKIDLDTASGSAVLSDIACSGVKISGVSGEVRVNGSVEKEVSIDTTSGAITFDGNAKSLSLDTASGSIQTKVDKGLKDFEVDTASGSVSLICGDASSLKSIDVDTASGSISLTLPEDTGFEVDFDSAFGSINNDFAMRSNEYLDGGYEISVDTASGSLELMRAS